MRIEIPDLSGQPLKAKSAAVKLEWKEDKEGSLYLVVTMNAGCELEGGGSVKPERKQAFDTHDSEACDAIRAFKRIADLLDFDIDVAADLANEQKPLFNVGAEAGAAV